MESIKDDVINEINLLELTAIRDNIEKMAKINQVEILRILQKNSKIILNENNYGVHINLTDLSNEHIIELKNYINYVNTQENNLKLLETQKDNLRNFFTDKADPIDNSKLSKDNVRQGVSVLY
jgi:maltose-binding protein MalE